jgi:nitrile hydratase
VRYTLNAPATPSARCEPIRCTPCRAVRIFNMDEYRYVIERMEPRHYLSASYYERPLTGWQRCARRKAL